MPDASPQLQESLHSPLSSPRPTKARDQISNAHKQWTVFVLALMMFSTTMDFMVIMPLGPRLMSLFQITPQQFSFLVSIYSFVAGIFGFLGSLVFDRLDRKHALIGAYLGFLIGTFFCAMAPNYSILLLARAFSGAFGGVVSGLSFAIVGDLFLLSERGLATGKLMTSYSVAGIVGVPTGLFLASNFGWHWTFGGIVSLGVIALFLAVQVIPNINWHLQSHYSGLFAGVTENFGDSNSRGALFTTLFMVHSQYVVIPFISAYLVSNAGFPEFHLPDIYLLGGILTVVSGISMGKLSDKFGAMNVFKKTGLLFLVPVFAITHLGHVSILITLLTTTSIFVLSSFRTVPAMTLISSSIPPSRRGSFMGLNTCMHQLGSASATFIAGWFVSTTGGTGSEITGFAYTAYLSIFFGICAYLFGRRIQVVS